MIKLELMKPDKCTAEDVNSQIDNTLKAALKGGNVIFYQM